MPTWAAATGILAAAILLGLVALAIAEYAHGRRHDK